MCFQFPVYLYLRVTAVYLLEVKEEGLIDMKLNNSIAVIISNFNTPEWRITRKRAVATEAQIATKPFYA